MFNLTSDMFRRFKPVPPLKTPWHATCKYPGIINATRTPTIMRTIDHPTFTSIKQAQAYYRIRRAGAGSRFAAMFVRARIVTVKR